MENFMEKGPRQPEQEPRKKPRLEFTEHHGIETDMTGCRSWNCWYEDKQYALWEINYESSDKPGATLPYYRLNWRPYVKEHSPYEFVGWQTVGDYGGFESAAWAAKEHAGIEHFETYHQGEVSCKCGFQPHDANESLQTHLAEFEDTDKA
jgi:hypothetical protein